VSEETTTASASTESISNLSLASEGEGDFGFDEAAPPQNTIATTRDEPSPQTHITDPPRAEVSKSRTVGDLDEAAARARYFERRAKWQADEAARRRFAEQDIRAGRSDGIRARVAVDRRERERDEFRARMSEQDRRLKQYAAWREKFDRRQRGEPEEEPQDTSSEDVSFAENEQQRLSAGGQ
jgi:hypothetical protein